MGLPPIKLRLAGDELHLVNTRELDRWGGFLSARRAAFTLVTPANHTALRTSFLVPPSTDSEGVFVELRKQLKDGSAGGLVTFDKLPAGTTGVEAFLIGGGEQPPPPVTPPVAPQPPSDDFPTVEDDDDFEPGKPEGEPAEPYEREDGEASDEDDE